MPSTRSICFLALLVVSCRSASSPAPNTNDLPSPSASSIASTVSAPSAPIPAVPVPAAPASSPAIVNVGLPADWAALPLESKTGMERSSSEGRVENGRVFEVARVELPKAVTQVMIPEGATVRRDAPSGTLFVAAEKALHFNGHPPEAMPLEGLRANLGCASKVEGDTLSIGTFGEWTSKEGGVSIAIVVRVPPSVRVGKMRELGGGASVAGQGDGPHLGHWYGHTAPSKGWERITFELDPRHIAVRHVP